MHSGKDKTFFFFGYERWNFRTANINRATVPTLAERNGDFSNTRDGTGPSADDLRSGDDAP